MYRVARELKFLTRDFFYLKLGISLPEFVFNPGQIYLEATYHHKSFILAIDLDGCIHGFRAQNRIKPNTESDLIILSIAGKARVFERRFISAEKLKDYLATIQTATANPNNLAQTTVVPPISKNGYSHSQNQSNGFPDGTRLQERALYAISNRNFGQTLKSFDLNPLVAPPLPVSGY